MYQPGAFREERVEVLHGLIRAYPLATLISAGAGGLLANLVPFLLVDNGGSGVLHGHVAKANDQVNDLRSGAETLVVFQGPQAYITPAWYPAKQEHGRVVPTWNYVTVQVRGTPRVVDDPEWLRAQVSGLTDAQEAGRSQPWRVSDAPEAFIKGQLGAIVGLEIPITALDGKWKVSQNRAATDRAGVVAGLRAERGDFIMARLVEERESD